MSRDDNPSVGGTRRKGIFNDFPTAVRWAQMMVSYFAALFLVIIPVLSDQPYLPALGDTLRDNGVKILIVLGVIAAVVTLSHLLTPARRKP